MAVALITGGSRGLGREICLVLSQKGYSIAINYLSGGDKAHDLMREITGGAIIVRADVGNREQMHDAAREIESRFGRLDIVINNAGIAIDNLIIRQSEEEWDRIIRTNLTGCFNVIKSMLPLLIKSGGGHIVNISSYSGLKGKSGQSAYSASKAAVLGLTRSLAVELAEYDIRVNAVLPGYMPTEMGKCASSAMDKAKKESILSSLSDAVGVGEFIAYLVTTKNITGQIFSMDSRIL